MQVKGMTDGFIATNRLTAPAAEIDAADVPDLNADCDSTYNNVA